MWKGRQHSISLHSFLPGRTFLSPERTWVSSSKLILPFTALHLSLSLYAVWKQHGAWSSLPTSSLHSKLGRWQPHEDKGKLNGLTVYCEQTEAVIVGEVSYQNSIVLSRATQNYTVESYLELYSRELPQTLQSRREQACHSLLHSMEGGLLLALLSLNDEQMTQTQTKDLFARCKLKRTQCVRVHCLLIRHGSRLNLQKEKCSKNGDQRMLVRYQAL